jgi:hypothetical protein
MTREELLQTILILAARAGHIPNRQDIEDQIDRMIAGIPTLLDQREWILSRALEILVTEVREAEVLADQDNHQPWLPDPKPPTWSSWPWLKLYLRHSLQRPPSVIQELDRSTDLVLNLLEDPAKEGIWDRRGLVMGHVQSGKTQHYTALAAKAIDAGYKVVIILSGIHENLRQQTQERVEQCISGKNSRDFWNPFGIRTFQNTYHGNDRPAHLLPDISSLTSIAGDYGAAINRTVDIPLGNIPVVLVVKKNVSILKNVLKKLRGPENNKTFQRAPVLVIDDEADHSSADTNDEDTDPTRINELIRKMLWCCDRVSFVGYTATPYANIYMDDARVQKTSAREIDDYGSDLFPHAFIISLKAPNNYVGPELVFGRDADPSVGITEIVPLPMEIDVNDADGWIPPRHRKSHVPQGMPDSLKQALKCFVLSVAARMALGDNTAHCSMLVHVTRFNDVQDRVMNQISAHLDSIKNTRLAGAPTDRIALLQEFEDLWNQEYAAKFPVFQAHPSQVNDPISLPTWQNVEGLLDQALEKLTCTIVNSLTRQNLDYAGNGQGLVVVAVGGDRLSRGLTLEGLTTSYFHRGAKAYDTLMQMGRWFGYRPRYTHLCRVFAPYSIISNFRKIILATEELRREFSRMIYLNKTPREYGLRIREPRGDLMVTALNKRRSGVRIKIHFAESLISSLDIREADLDTNLDALRNLVQTVSHAHGQPLKTDAQGNVQAAGPCRIWREVDWAAVGPFLLQYNANINVCLERSPVTGASLLHDYIDSVAAHGELVKWTVAVIGAGNGARPVDCMDPDFRTVSRNRLMHKLAPLQPENIGRVAFQGVALGGDEAIDLTPQQRASADQQWNACGREITRASFYRAERPSTHGLLLIYPIMPATPKAAESERQQDKHYQWGQRDPVIGVAISLPASDHDSGCVYVCNRQKKREMFGEAAEDEERDDEERNDEEPWDQPVPLAPAVVAPAIYESLLKIMCLDKGVIPVVEEDPVSMPSRIIKEILDSSISDNKGNLSKITEREREKLSKLLGRGKGDLKKIYKKVWGLIKSEEKNLPERLAGWDEAILYAKSLTHPAKITEGEIREVFQQICTGKLGWAFQLPYEGTLLGLQIRQLLSSPGENDGSDPNDDSKPGSMDLWGIYSSGKRKVVLYTRAIELSARAKGIRYDDLYTIVLCHELAHAANHLGVDKSQGIWERFAQATSEDLEFFAQIYAHHHFDQGGMKALVSTMRDITRNQPLKYGEYLAHLDKTVDEINERLMQARAQ